MEISLKILIVYQMGRLCGGAHEISGIKAPIYLHRWVGVVGWVVVGWMMVGWVVVGAVIRSSFQSNSNSQKLSLWCKKKNLYPPRWICMTHIWFPTEFPRGITIFQGVLTKFSFLMKFPHLEKNC